LSWRKAFTPGFRFGKLKDGFLILSEEASPCGCSWPQAQVAYSALWGNASLYCLMAKKALCRERMAKNGDAFLSRQLCLWRAGAAEKKIGR